MKIIITILVALLLITNAFWLYQVVDTGVTNTYREQHIYELEETRKQLMATLPAVAFKVNQMEIVSAARKFTKQEVYEKNGCVWIGWLGFRFDQNHRLLSVSPSWSDGTPDPCYP